MQRRCSMRVYGDEGREHPVFFIAVIVILSHIEANRNFGEPMIR